MSMYPRPLLLAALLAVAIATTCGCVRRVMLIQSDPQGALVSVDRTVVGHTPVAVPFTYYGTREIRLEKDGFEPLTAQQRVVAPWYEIPPISFFSNHFAFREIRDTRAFDFRMRPKTITDESQLIERATQMRTDVGRGTIARPMLSRQPDGDSATR
jgi:hypothetical protein